MAVLVSVVIPAFNAAATIGETLCSVRAQSFSNLEIIVVDDGSTDATADVAGRHAAVDARVRVIRQANAGVAAARNTGWMASTGEMIAFVDADDLWAEAKIARQVGILSACDERVGVNYCFYARIGWDNTITDSWEQAGFEGDILDRLLMENFIGGNGSTMLMRRAVLEAVGGFDSAFRHAGAEGCDDYLFTCRVAETFHFSAVKDVLVGYRHTPGSLSSNLVRVLNSRLMAAEILAAKYPGKRAIIEGSLPIFADWIIRNAIFLGPRRQLPELLWILLCRYPRMTLGFFVQGMPEIMMDVGRRAKLRLRKKLVPQKVTPVPAERFATGVIENPDAA